MDVSITGTGLHPFGRFEHATVTDMGVTAVKAALAKHFDCCRAGGQALAIRRADGHGEVLVRDAGKLGDVIGHAAPVGGGGHFCADPVKDLLQISRGQAQGRGHVRGSR